MHLKETDLLLKELAAGQHPAAADLRTAVALDGFLSGALTAADAAEFAQVSEEGFRTLLEHRRISHLLATHEGTPAGDIELSIVLPVYNEEGNVEELYHRLVQSLSDVSKYELIFVNNGSTDRSHELISEIQRSDPSVRIISLSRNFGHQGAITAGMDHSRGRAVILMDADLQDPPEVLPEMITKWREGADVVYAVRQKRKDNVIKRAAYFAFYRILSRFAEIDIPLDSGDFCLMDRAVVENLKALPEKVRFMRGLRAWIGFKQVPLHYERAARHAGESKYRVSHLFRFAFDGIVSFSSLPLRMASYVGLLICLGGVGYLAFALVSHFVSRIPEGWTSTVAIMLLLGGAQLLLLGVLGEYVARIYNESKKRPAYIVRSIEEDKHDGDN